MKFETLWRGLFFRNHYLGNGFSPKAGVKLTGRKAPVIIEVGSADGLDTRKFLREMKGKGRLLAIEPDPRFLRSLEGLAIENCEVFPVAIADSDGLMNFYQSNTPYSSSLKSPNTAVIAETWPEISFPSSVQVVVRSLDSLAKEVGLEVIDLIWADVQGAEDMLIKGGQATLARTRYLYTEFSEFEYYSGALTLAALQKELGANWVLLRRYQGDALFKNTQLKSASLR